MPEHSSVAFTFVEQLDQSSSVDEVMDAVQRAFSGFGFDTFFFCSLPRPVQCFEDVALAVRVPPEFLKVYQDEQYVQVSPALRHCRLTARPFAWRSAPYNAEWEPRAGKLVDLVTDFGLLDGLVVPIPSPTGCEASVWLTGNRPEFAAFHVPVIHVVTLYAFDRIRIVANRIPNTKCNLTAREREVLTWAAVGKSAWEIGEILSIAKRTVDEHSQTAMQKLGAVNRAQAVAIAIRCRLIKPFGE